MIVIIIIIIIITMIVIIISLLVTARSELRNVVFSAVCNFFVSLLWPPYVIGQAIVFLPCGFFILLSTDRRYIFFFFLA